MAAEQTSLRYTNPATGYSVYLQDDEDLLDSLEEEGLVEHMIPITAYGNCAFDSRDVRGQSSYDYVRANYNDYFYNSGTLFLIDMGNRQIKLYNSKDIEKTVTSSYANSIADNIYSYASHGDYYTCAVKAFDQELTLLKGGRIAQPMKYISCAMLALILALLINYIIVRLKSKNTKTSQAVIMEAVAASAILSSAGAVVTKRVRHSSGSSHGGGDFGGGF